MLIHKFASLSIDSLYKFRLQEENINADSDSSSLEHTKSSRFVMDHRKINKFSFEKIDFVNSSYQLCRFSAVRLFDDEGIFDEFLCFC